MNKATIIESKEIERILKLHNKEKNAKNKIILEQAQYKSKAELTKFFTDAKNAGCLTDPNLDFVNFKRIEGEPGSYIKAISKTTGNVKRVYDDYTWKVVNPEGKVIKSGTWKCDAKPQSATDSVAGPAADVTDVAAKLSEYKNQGYQEYKDVVQKTKVDDPKFYQVIAFKGVPTDKLYRPLYSMNTVGKLDTWPVNSEQRKVLDTLIGQGYVIDPNQADRMRGVLKPYNPPVDASLFPNGLTVYTDVRQGSQSNVSDSQQTLQSSIVGAENCEKNVQLYWDSYKNNIPSSGSDFDNLKNVVQACVNQNMYRWKNIGGVLGIGGGSRHLDKILEVMTNKTQEYEKTRLPGNGTPWALNAPRIQGRGR